MRNFALALPLCAAVLAACERSTTAPIVASLRGPDHLVIGSTATTWVPQSLDFDATAMNDAGTIVGVQYPYATKYHWGVVRQNGTETMLPPPSGFEGTYHPVAISPKGYIVGEIDTLPYNRIVIWTSPTSKPSIVYIGDANLSLTPISIDDDGAVVGNMAYGGPAWRWTAQTGMRWLANGGGNVTVAGLNGSGYAVGWGEFGSAFGSWYTRAVRWDPNGNLTILPLPALPTGTTASTTMANAINDRGDAAGSYSVACSAGVCSQGVVVWHLDGSVTAGFADADSLLRPALISSAGRIVGQNVHGQIFTMFNGVVTWFPVSGAGYAAYPRGVSACGSILTDGHNGSYLWVKSGTTASCDASPSSPTTLTLAP